MTTVAEYIKGLPEGRRADVQALHRHIRKVVPQLKPAFDGRMIGYGPYHYRYESGREGDSFIVGLASNKAGISLYVQAGRDGKYLAEIYAPKLGKASCGKACIRFKRLSELNLDAVTDILVEAAALHGRDG